MSQHVAIYEVLTDEVIQLESPDIPGNQATLNRRFNFTPPSNTATDNRAVLTFNFGITNAVNMSFRADLNGIAVAKFTQNGNSKGYYQEVVGNSGNNLLQPGVQNHLDCQIIGGTGKLGISDMVIWYQRNV